jgi:hypothetical protein
MGHLKKQHVPCSGHSILHLLLRNTSSITGKQIQIFLAQVFTHGLSPWLWFLPESGLLLAVPGMGPYSCKAHT